MRIRRRPTVQRASTPTDSDWISESIAELLERLATSPGGLSETDAQTRLEEAGPNRLAAARETGLLPLLIRQLVHPLALLLWVAAGLALATQSPTLGLAILAVIALNAAFALMQERHAEHAVAALSAYLPLQATVLRGGRRQAVDASLVVPGDILVVEAGDAICADGRLLAGAVEVDLSAVTGESAPAVRDANLASKGDRQRLTDAGDVVLSGTTCTSGEATAVAIRTGMDTELGRIATLSSRTRSEPSPLEQQVRRVAWLIAGVAAAVGLAFLPLGVVAGLSLGDAAIFAIGLLVANVPEGLLPTITLALAVGVSELARIGGLVKRLSAVETLGSTDVICTDKTGTLTQNRMHLHSVWDASGRSAPAGPVKAMLGRVLRSCTTADLDTGQGDPTELALLTAAGDLGGGADPATTKRTFHFDPRLRLMSVLAEDSEGGGAAQVLTKGAPEEVVKRCGRTLTSSGEARVLSDDDRADIHRRLDELASRGLRILACATRPLPAGELGAPRESVETDLDLIGFVALTDPIREAVPDAVTQAHRAGITVHVISGDSGATAGAIAAAAGIGVAGRPKVVSGIQLEAMADAELDALLAGGDEIVFARNSPEDKLRIATRLQGAGHVVAMTGDGVNDAPALRRADIGVAMGVGGTDVAREASTMVLTDDNFATIIRAVECGRRVYDNVRKFILYIFAHSIPEIVPFLAFALSGGAIPLGLTVVQILMIDLGTETLPALALGREAAEPGLMRRAPRSRHESIITGSMLVRAWAILGTVSAILVMTGFVWVLWSGGWRPGQHTGEGSHLHETYLRATTMTFAGIVACQVGTAFAARTDRVSLLSIGVLSNRWLLAGIAFEIVLTGVVIYLPAAQSLFGTRSLKSSEVAVLALFPVLVWAADEGYRAILRRRRR